MDTWGKFLPDEKLMRADDKFEAALMNAAPLSAPLTTEQPILDIPTSAYFHGPMPDKAIAQHLLHRRTTSAVIDGSGSTQVLEVPMEAADPNFYFLRDSDGSRRVLEVRDTVEPVDMRAHGRALDERSKVQRVGMLQSAAIVGPMKSKYAEEFADPVAKADLIERTALEIRNQKAEEAKTSKAYGEQNRIIIPHTFKHEMGIPSIDRKTEILMKTREQPKNPPRAAVAAAKDLIYSSAPPPQAEF
eukprot:Tamp_07567.p1 GENE.Tamp_07567~~Tamp_07567.p1  ORF type:complete len:245 (+),score=50.79 Tamp_07567:1084-1818(+)